MDVDMKSKINRLNELYAKQENGEPLTNVELNEQSILREEVLNYFNYVIGKHMESLKKL